MNRFLSYHAVLFTVLILLAAGCAEVDFEEMQDADAPNDQTTNMAPGDTPQDDLTTHVDGFREIDPEDPPPGSPVGRALTYVGDAYVHVTYSRPYIRGREIFGDLIPYGEVWPAGAHMATEIAFTQPVLVDGEELDAGLYSIFVTPEEDEWQIHFNTELGMHMTGRYDADNNVLTTTQPVETLDEVVDPHTIDFEEQNGARDLRLSWDQTRVRVPLAPVDNNNY